MRILHFIPIKFIGIVLILSSVSFASCNNSGKSKDQKQESITSQSSAVLSVIFDTDIQGDYDDVGALAMLHAFADSGKVKILGTISSNRSPLVAPTLEVINTYFGRPEIPIGVLKEGGVKQDARELHWPDSLMAHYPHTYKNNDQAPEAVEVYRRILAHQPDSSVTIISVGFLTNLKNLLLSTSDSLSPLNGRDLVAKKVKKWVAMAGRFPKGKETNIRRDSTASQYVIDNWPTPIVFSGFEVGVKIKTGLRLIKNGSSDSPIRMVFSISIHKRSGDKNGHSSYDQTAVLVAVKGFDHYFDYKTGWFITSPDGSNQWKNDPKGRHKYLVMKMSADSINHVIEDLMMHKPMY